MSLLTQVYLMEKYGPRLSLDALAEALGSTKNTLYNQISQGTCPVPTYVDGGKRWAAMEDVAEYFSAARRKAA
ncbi:MAG: hypothetical protein NTX56_12130 [Proteobacteria bacterium]|nr:hypothetical protein [Pseudomonadota bacterium]